MIDVMERTQTESSATGSTAAKIGGLLAERAGIRLDIGGGQLPQPGFVNMDIRPLPGVDIVWDVNRHPWPLPDECVLTAVCSHLVEHIPPVAITPDGTRFPFMEFMDEVWRIMKIGGEFALSLPHGSSEAFNQDPTHCNPCNETTWAYFDPFENRAHGQLWAIYKPKPWRIKYLTWSPAAYIEVILVKRSLGEIEEQPEGEVVSYE